MWWFRNLLIVLIVVMAAVPAAGQNASTISTLTVSSSFDLIRVKQAFTGDADGDNSATVEFRRTGTSTWYPTFPPFCDHRATIGGTANPGANQCRTIVAAGYHQPGSSWDIRVTMSDPDGVTGSNPVTSATTLIAETPPGLTSHLYVDDDNSGSEDGTSAHPYNTIPEAISAASAGTKIHVRPGTYANFTMSKSGNASAYIAIVGDERDTVFITGGAGVAQNILVSSSVAYVQFKNLRAKSTTDYSIYVSANAHHIWMENIYHENVAGSGACTTARYDDAGVYFDTGTHDNYILYNQFYSAFFDGCNVAGDAFDQGGAAVYGYGMGSAGGQVFKGNIVSAGFRDCVGDGGESWGDGFRDNADIIDNNITGCKDDGIQMEGEDMNLAIIGNYVLANKGYSQLAMAPHLVGPVFVVRNIFDKPSTSLAGYFNKWGEGTAGTNNDGHAHYFHNSTRGAKTGGEEGFNVNGTTTPLLFNNSWYLSVSGANLFNGFGAGYSTDYTKHDYNLCQGFTSCPAETHGLTGNPNYQDAALRILSSSSLHDAGRTIDGWNDAQSPWPAVGTPDIGAWEVGSVATSFVATPSCTGIASVSVAGATALAISGQTLNVTGCNFGASQGSGSVKLCEESTFSASVNCTTQTVTAWSATKIAATVSMGTHGGGPMYVYVTPNGGSPNTNGFAMRLMRAVI